MRFANEILALWYMVCCTYILIVTDDSNVYMSFIGLHVFVAGIYKWMQEREAKKDADKIPRE